MTPAERYRALLAERFGDTRTLERERRRACPAKSA